MSAWPRSPGNDGWSGWAALGGAVGLVRWAHGRGALGAGRCAGARKPSSLACSALGSGGDAWASVGVLVGSSSDAAIASPQDRRLLRVLGSVLGCWLASGSSSRAKRGAAVCSMRPMACVGARCSLRSMMVGLFKVLAWVVAVVRLMPPCFAAASPWHAFSTGSLCFDRGCQGRYDCCCICAQAHTMTVRVCFLDKSVCTGLTNIRVAHFHHTARLWKRDDLIRAPLVPPLSS